MSTRLDSPDTTVRATPKKARPRGKSKSWWMRQLHALHSISAAISLFGMLMFALTGLTLNHAGSIPATPKVVDRTATLAPSLLPMLKATPSASDAPMPEPVAHAVADAVGLDPTRLAGEWSDDEVYVAMPRPGGDAWVSVDRTTGTIKSEVTYQGLISLLNDLHKGRNTGLPWRIFIDVFAVACILFTGTGLVLLHLHSSHRKSNWPLVGLGLAVPVIVALLFIH